MSTDISITRRTEEAFSGLQKEFQSICDIRDFEAKLTALKKAWGTSDKGSKLRALFDLFDLYDIKYEKGQDFAYYEALVRNSDITDFNGLEDRMVYALYTRYKEYPSPEDYMKRMVDRLCNDEDGWTSDTLRVRILKQFIKYGNCLKYKKETGGTETIYNGEGEIKRYLKEKTGKKKVTLLNELDQIEDDVFDVLETATPEQKKPNGKFGLLKMVDDLAGGQFRTGGSTKKSLYLFAMIYGMTYYSGGSDILDKDTDIEKNLFQDYYTNNLIRFITKAYKEKDLCEFESDPSGQGINYKNFAEIIYLYFISQDITPQEKIKQSHEMIERVKERQKNHRGDHQSLEEVPKQTANKGTAYYRGFFKMDDEDHLYSEDIMRMEPAAFEDFVFDKYNCETSVGKTVVGEMQLEDEQKTAFRIYEMIIEDLIWEIKKNVDEDEDFDDYSSMSKEEKAKEREKWLSDCSSGLWFTDAAALKQNGFKSIRSRQSDEDQNRFEEFVELLLGMDQYMGYDKALSVSSADKVTRTKIIVAYYYYYNELHGQDEEEDLKSFQELYDDFAYGVDEKLKEAYYQPLNSKNLFDVLIAFSSYAYLHI